MPTLIITRGLPAAGKSTKARAWVAEDPQRRFRVNRDDLRAMAHDSVYIGQTATDPGTERAIQSARDSAITALLKRGVSVVCDDTNLVQRVARDLRRLAVLTGSDFEVWDLTDVPLETCLERNAARLADGGLVPQEAILDMHQRYLAGKPHSLPLPDETADPAPGELVQYVPPAGAPTAVIVDVDGTVALMVARSPYDESRVHEDRPNVPVIAVVRALAAAGNRIVFCSGRTEACRTATEKWLVEHVAASFDGLHMRPVGDFRQDNVVKLELFDQHIRHQYRVTAVIDDRASVVTAWRSIGLTVLQCAPGDF